MTRRPVVVFTEEAEGRIRSTLTNSGSPLEPVAALTRRDFVGALQRQLGGQSAVVVWPDGSGRRHIRGEDGAPVPAAQGVRLDI